MAQNNSILLVLLTALSASMAVQPSVAQEVSTDRCPQSDLLLENAVVYTADDEQWSAEAVAIRGDRIVFVGSAKEANQWHCGAARVIDLEGAAVFPGFTDSHQHLEGVGRRTRTLSLFGIATLASTVSAIERWSEQVETGDWVLGRGWIEREWTDEQRFLTRHDVDAFTADKPLYLPAGGWCVSAG